MQLQRRGAIPDKSGYTLCCRRRSCEALSILHSRRRNSRRLSTILKADLHYSSNMAATTSLIPNWYSGDSLYKDCPAGKALGPEGIMLEFVNARGLKLASYVFPAKGEAKALVILVHGHGASLLHEYLHHEEPGKPGIYQGSIVERLNESGIAAAGIDLQGCGHSEGLRCYVDTYQEYVDDNLDFARWVQTCSKHNFQGLPKFLMGTSLGGCISSDLCRQSDMFAGAVLLAPMLSLERVSNSGLNPYLRPLAGLLSWLLPTARIAKTERNDLYPHIQAFFDQDPQTWKEWTRARNAYQYLTATENLCANMSSLTFPFVCYHGEVDTMTDPEGSRKLYAESKATDKELNIMPHRWHVLLKEEGCHELYTKIVEWVKKRS